MKIGPLPLTRKGKPGEEQQLIHSEYYYAYAKTNALTPYYEHIRTFFE